LALVRSQPPEVSRWPTILSLLGIVLLALLHFGMRQDKITTGVLLRICSTAVVLVVLVNCSGCGGASISPANAQSTPQIFTPSGNNDVDGDPRSHHRIRKATPCTAADPAHPDREVIDAPISLPSPRIKLFIF
jgi:hypothetical protein